MSRITRAFAAALYSPLCVALLTADAFAQGTDTSRANRPDTAKVRTLGTVTITGRADNLLGLASTASQGHIGSAEIRRRPLMREGELLETVPGLIVTQHSGDGKANQYFIRGFNLDHGTDFQTKVEGMPVNMPSHAHGQGYTDLNFLIPEFVDYIDYRLGVYHAAIGDFGSAGAAEFRLMHRVEKNIASVEGGENGWARAVIGASPKLGSGDFLVGGEIKRYDGPWDVAEKLRKFSGLARYSWTKGSSQFSLLGMGYRNRWNSADQIPLRAVTAGTIGRFGVVDSTDGGNTQRYSISGSWSHVGARAVDEVRVFGVYSDLSLFSNFTYTLEREDSGDQFNQHEQRRIIGASATRRQQASAFGISHDLTLGVQARADFLSPVALRLTQRRQLTSTVREDKVNETGSGLFLEATSQWRPWMRTTIGVRGDMLTFDVTSNVAQNSGRRSAGIVSPKASFTFATSRTTEVSVSGGFGFHSNDARGTTIRVDPVTGDPAERVDPLVRSRGAEIGLRANPLPSWRSTLVAWTLELDSELLFVGDAGATEPSSRTRRTGITFANFYRPIPQMTLDADVSLSHSRLDGVERSTDHIPGALENVFAGGITWTPEENGVFGSIRLRHFGAYPLIEDNSVRARPTTLVNAGVGFSMRTVRIQLTLLNVLNRRANDIQYFYESRLDGEASAVGDVHLHPVEPRQLRLGISRGMN